MLDGVNHVRVRRDVFIVWPPQAVDHFAKFGHSSIDSSLILNIFSQKWESVPCRRELGGGLNSQPRTIPTMALGEDWYVVSVSTIALFTEKIANVVSDCIQREDREMQDEGEINGVRPGGFILRRCV